MAVKRGRITGSALATLLGALLFRGAATGPAVSGEGSHAGIEAAATTEAAAKKASTKPKSKATASEDENEKVRILKGPWVASQKYFAGQGKSDEPPCPSEFKADPPRRAPKKAPEEDVALDDGTVRVTPGGTEYVVHYPRKELWCIPDDEDDKKLRALILIVPDPMQTHLALFMDRMIEAVQLAAESMDYVVDRYWLPWDLGPRQEWGDYESFKDATRDKKREEMEPGLLMFRLNNQEVEQTRPQALYVFVVGELPTAGVNGEQFAKAVEYVRLVERHSAEQRWVPIHVVGPTLSGSLGSLDRLTRAQGEVQGGEPKNVFSIYNGTVLLTDKEVPFASFHRFQNPAAEGLEALMAMLKKDGHIDCDRKPLSDDSKPVQVAVLSEADTVYGASARIAAQSTNCFDILEYPREIANLRNAYTAATAQNPAVGGKPGAKAPPLSLNLTDPTNSSDEAPDFSRNQSPLSKEAVLMNFAAEMHRKRYKYVGIIGTNELDVVFLISFVRGAVPDARVFLMDSDLLLQHRPDNVPYIGTFSVTTYPLLNRQLNKLYENNSPESPINERIRLPFSTRFEEGGYNATVCMVRHMLGEDYPDSKLGYLAERADCWNEDPPLWLTAFGTGGPWPVAILPKVIDRTAIPKDAPSTGRCFLRPCGATQKVAIPDDSVPPPRPKDLPIAWKILCGLLSVFAGFCVLVLCGAWPFSPRLRDFILGTFAPFQQLVAIHLGSATLAAALVMVGLSAPGVHWRVMAAGAAAGTFLMVFWVLTYRRYGAWWFIPALLAAGAVYIAGLLPQGDRWVMMAGVGTGALLSACSWVTTKYKYLQRWNADRKKKKKAERLLSSPLKFSEKMVDGISQVARFACVPCVWLAAGFLVRLWWILLNDPCGHYGAFFSYRALHLGSVVSPLTPMLPLLAAVFLAAIFYAWHSRFDNRVRSRLYPDSDFEKLSPEMRENIKDRNKLRPGLRSEPYIAKAINQDWWNLVYGIAIFVSWVAVVGRPQFSLFEKQQFRWLYESLFGLVILLILVSGRRLYLIWGRLRRLLLDLNRQRVRHVFSQLQGNGGWTSVWFYGSEDPDWDYMHRSHEVLQQLAGNRVVPLDSSEANQALNRFLHQRWDERIDLDMSFGSSLYTDEGIEEFHKLEELLFDAQNCLAVTLVHALDLLLETWEKHPPDLEEAEEAKSKEVIVVQYVKESEKEYFKEPDREPEWRKLLEKFVALRYAAFIRGVIGRIRLLIIFLAAAFTLALASLMVYAFEPHRELIWSVTALFIVIGVITVRVMMEMYRDPILSMITGTKANELGLEFYVRLIALGIGPVLTLLATHFPMFSQSLLSLLQPGLEIMK